MKEREFVFLCIIISKTNNVYIFHSELKKQKKRNNLLGNNLGMDKENGV